MGDIRKEAIQKHLMSESQMVFNEEFNDRLLKFGQKLDDLFVYIRENPLRRLVYETKPQYFTKIQSIEINEKFCQSYGNQMLLRNPFKQSVVIHRRSSNDEKRYIINSLLESGERGSVLVGAFISPDEKTLLKATVSLGLKIILITNKLLTEKEKPYKTLFNLCQTGRLLILAPHEISSLKPKIPSRGDCLFMNSFAQTLASSSPATE